MWCAWPRALPGSLGPQCQCRTYARRTWGRTHQPVSRTGRTTAKRGEVQLLQEAEHPDPLHLMRGGRGAASYLIRSFGQTNKQPTLSPR
jgi:hypothetical protein